jgi:predicted RNA binding protein YcfA (HicA-like mRNA interferase family)
MPKLPRVTAKKVVAVLLREKFYIHHQSGSHVHLRHQTKLELRLVVPMHDGDLAPKTIKTIIAQAGLSVEQFRDLI